MFYLTKRSSIFRLQGHYNSIRDNALDEWACERDPGGPRV